MAKILQFEKKCINNQGNATTFMGKSNKVITNFDEYE